MNLLQIVEQLKQAAKGKTVLSGYKTTWLLPYKLYHFCTVTASECVIKYLKEIRKLTKSS